jgi:hypothetical protein
MADTEDLTIVTTYLTHAGLEVTRIPECQAKRCDLMARADGEALLIEVKGIHDDEAIAAALAQGNLFTGVRPLDASRSVEKAVRQAAQQLDMTSIGDEFRLVAMRIRSGFDQQLARRQIVGELYGKRSLVDMSATHLECIYFAHSAFHRLRGTLDAALVVDDDGATLFLNDYSNNFAGIRQSTLARFLEQHGAVYDAARYDAEGWLRADCDIDRSDEKAVLRYVSEKYGLQGAHVVRFQRYTAYAERGHTASP